MRAGLLAPFVALVVAGAGCGNDPATGLVVVVDADPAIAARVGAIRVQTFEPAGTNAIDTQLFEIGVRYRFPVSFGVTPRPGSAQVRVEAAGIDRTNATPFVFARATTRYVEGRVLTLSLVLWGACADRPTPCPLGTTCTSAGECDLRAAIVDPTNLPTYTASADAQCPPGMVRDRGVCVSPPDAGARSDVPATDTPATDVPATDAGPTEDATTDVPVTIDAPDVTDVPADLPAMDAPPTDVPVMDVPPDARDAGPDVSCTASQTLCSGRCVNLSGDPFNCGACGAACGGGAPCLTGTCAQVIVGLAAGGRSTCTLQRGGGVQCWGSNATGELGSDVHAMSSRPEPALVTASATDIVLGTGFGCVRHSAQRNVQCWGDNTYGTVGIGTPGGPPRSASGSVLQAGGGSLGNVTALAAGDSHVCALREDSTVRCWGRNVYGELGDGTVNDATTAVLVLGGSSTLRDVIAVAAGANTTYAITSAGSLLAWGRNDRSELGDAAFTGASRRAPTVVPGLTDVRTVRAGHGTACAVTGEERSLFCWGANDGQQLGATPATVTVPRRMALPQPVRDVAVGRGFLCALLVDGSVQCAGANGQAQLGDGTLVGRGVFAVATGVVGALSIAAGAEHACIRGPSNASYCWGSDRFGQTGSGRLLYTQTPRAVPMQPAGGVAGISAFETGSCMRTPSNTAYCWGYNRRGELGDGATAPSGTPRPVLNDVGGLALEGVRSIVSAGAATCTNLLPATTSLMVCWGANDGGVLGNGSMGDRNRAVGVRGLTGVLAMGMRHQTACAVTTGGALHCWGANEQGQAAGMSAGRTFYAPTMLYAGGFEGAAPGFDHTCALRTDGGVVCWGNGDRGQLGDGTTARRDPPARPEDTSLHVSYPAGGTVRTIPAFAEVASGARFSCGITVSRAEVRCWGSNTLGQLGPGTPDDGVHADAQPVASLPSGRTFFQITAGANHACVRTNAGEVYCWGDNAYGAMGDNVFGARGVLITFPSLGPIVNITAGTFHTCAHHATTGVSCWGLNTDGQLGTTDLLVRTSAVRVNPR